MQGKIEIIKQKLKTIRFLQGISREKKIIGVLIFVLVGFLLYQSLLATQFLRLKAIDFQFSSQKKLVNFYRWLEGNTGILVNETKEKENNLLRMKESFIRDDELSNYFTNFRNLAKSHNLTVITLDFKPQKGVVGVDGKPLEYFQKLPLDVSLKGDYFNMMFLLYKLERGRPVFEINSVHLKQESPESYALIMDMKAALYVLMRKEPK